MGQFDYIHPALRPQNDAEAMLFAEEAFVADIQSLLHRLLEGKGISRANVAKRLGVSRPRVTQLLADDCHNLNVRTVARIFHALGEEPVLSCEWSEMQAEARTAECRDRAIINAGAKVTGLQAWTDEQDQRSSRTAKHKGGDNRASLAAAVIANHRRSSNVEFDQLQKVA